LSSFQYSYLFYVPTLTLSAIIGVSHASSWPAANVSVVYHLYFKVAKPSFSTCHQNEKTILDGKSFSLTLLQKEFKI
jgi:hypothetical protein